MFKVKSNMSSIFPLIPVSSPDLPHQFRQSQKSGVGKKFTNEVKAGVKLNV